MSANEVETPHRLDCAAGFFYRHSGWQWDPATETSDQGRRRCAETSANAEAYASHVGRHVEWQRDPDAGRADAGTEWADWPHYEAVLLDSEGEILASLGSVMFAEGLDFRDDPYARCVAADLAYDAVRARDMEPASRCPECLTAIRVSI